MVLALVILGIFLILSIAIFRVKAVTVKVVLIALLTFMAFLQAFIFMILTYVYIAGSVMMEHDEH